MHCFWTLRRPSCNFWHKSAAVTSQQLTRQPRHSSLCTVCWCIKLLGVMLASTPSFNKHVVNVTCCCHYHISALHHGLLLTPDADKVMTVSIIGSWLDYCNNVLYGMSHVNTDTACAKCSGMSCWEGTMEQSTFVIIYTDCLFVIVLPTNCAWLPGKHFIMSNLPISLN